MFEVGRCPPLMMTFRAPNDAMIRAASRRLVSLRCNDGSNPFAGDLQAAHMSRAGSFGPGGRCDSIIDRYDVKCPEATYQVFADMYLCTPGVEKGF